MGSAKTKYKGSKNIAHYLQRRGRLCDPLTSYTTDGTVADAFESDVTRTLL